MSKNLSEQVFPVENYTDKIHIAVKATIGRQIHVSFTVAQLLPFVQRGYPWLQNVNERQKTLLKQIVKTGLTKLVQLGLVKKVHSTVQVEPQWQWASTVAESGYINVTSEDSVAHTDEARKAVGRRALGGQSLHRLNGKIRLGLLHA